MKKLLLLFTMLLSVAAASGQREPYPIQDLARPAHEVTVKADFKRAETPIVSEIIHEEIIDMSKEM